MRWSARRGDSAWFEAKCFSRSKEQEQEQEHAGASYRIRFCLGGFVYQLKVAPACEIRLLHADG